MSIELHIFVHDSPVPSRESWQQAIDEMSLSMILYETLEVRTHTGFLPTILAGEPTGFEFCLEPTEDVLSSYAHIRNKVSDREKGATFIWGGNQTEMTAALSAAAALIKLSDGVYYYPSDNVIYDSDEAVEAIRADLNAL